MRWAWGAALDLCFVIVFAGLGRATHAEAITVAGVAATAWPFAAGAAGGWMGIKGWRRPAAIIPTGISVWLATVAAGMVLRAMVGQGTAPAFVVVAFLLLGAAMLGWRAVAGLAMSVRARAR